MKTMNWALLLVAVAALATRTYAADPDPKVADAIAQIEARRTEKTAAEAKSVQARTEEGNDNAWGGKTRKHGGGGDNKNADKGK